MQSLAPLLPWADRQGRFSALRAATFAFLLVPAALLAQAAWMGQLGSKPWTQAVHDTGTWSLRILLVTLAVTPLRRITGWNKLVGVRRMLGLGAMTYALGHLTLYCIDLAFDWGLILSEIVKRFYLVVGMTALAGLVVLGATSTDGMVRRLGAQRWQRLHKLVYPITALALFHFALQAKIDVTEPVLMIGLFVLLMALRFVDKRFGLGWTRVLPLALACGFATALIEAAWYALATGVEPLAVLSANIDALSYFELAFLRPAHWVLLAGLAFAGLAAWKRPKPQRARQPRPVAA